MRVPNLQRKFPLVRTRRVLVGIDVLSERNLSRNEEYHLKSKTPLVSVLLRAAAERMRAAGIEPLETTEAEHASGRLVISLTLLESRSVALNWLAGASIQAVLHSKGGAILGRWQGNGRGSHPDSRIRAGAAGLAMGQAISQALSRLPWGTIMDMAR